MNELVESPDSIAASTGRLSSVMLIVLFVILVRRFLRRAKRNHLTPVVSSAVAVCGRALAVAGGGD